MTEDQQRKEYLWPGIKCVKCGYIGILENQGILFDGKTDDIPNSRYFMYTGHNSFSGKLHYKCSLCEKIIIVDPMDVLGAVGSEIITDVRKKPREKGFFASFFSQPGGNIIWRLPDNIWR